MNINLTSKTALVGGSSQGIGRASAIELALLGANVVLMARTESTLQEVLGLLDTSKGQKHSYIVGDASRPEELQEKVAAFAAQNPIHILVNNTGGPPAGLIRMAKADEFLKAMTAHLLCNHLLTQAVLEGMKTAGYGRIINVISTSVKQPLDNLGVSNTTRAAVANWAKTLANEVAAWGITVNNVLPGATHTGRLDAIIKNNAAKKSISETEMKEEMEAEIPARRVGLPEEIAAAVAFLATPAAAYINGINLPVDGGRLKTL